LNLPAPAGDYPYENGVQAMAQEDAGRVYDELLVMLVQAGDRRAGERLAARWQPRLLGTARRLLRDPEQAHDAVQEAWIGIFRGAASLGDPARFPAWAFGILHRKCADRIRSERRLREAPEIATAPVKQGDDRMVIAQALNGLSDDHRTAAILFFGEGLTLAETAAATGVPLGTAKSRIFHARRQLKAALTGDLT
jgi:RNA polymerase sigma-70 factor (ECF subfamily)